MIAFSCSPEGRRRVREREHRAPCARREAPPLGGALALDAPRRRGAFAPDGGRSPSTRSKARRSSPSTLAYAVRALEFIARGAEGSAAASIRVPAEGCGDRLRRGSLEGFADLRPYRASSSFEIRYLAISDPISSGSEAISDPTSPGPMSPVLDPAFLNPVSPMSDLTIANPASLDPISLISDTT